MIFFFVVVDVFSVVQLQLSQFPPLIFNWPAQWGEGQRQWFSSVVYLSRHIPYTRYTWKQESWTRPWQRKHHIAAWASAQMKEQKAGNSKAESYKGPTIPGDIEEEKAREEANCLITYFMNTLIISSFTTGCPTYTNCFPQKNNIENKWASGN